MKNNSSLSKKILQSVYIYETKRFTAEALFKTVVLCISIIVIVTLGGVIGDLFIESEMSKLINEFIKAGEYSYTYIVELFRLILNEIPAWVIGVYGIGLFFGCILVLSVYNNKNLIIRKIYSIIHYWFSR